MLVTVYTNPSCVQCEQTKIYLNRAGVKYDVIDMSTDPAALDMVKGLGFRAAPVVITDDDMWSGFQMEKLAKLVESVRPAEDE